MTLASLLAALMAVCAWLSIPVSDISITMQTFGVSLALLLLGGSWGSVSIGIYLLLGIPAEATALRGLIYAIVMTALFFASFVIQQRWVFAKDKN